MPRDSGTALYTRVDNSFSNPVFGTTISPTDADTFFDDVEAAVNAFIGTSTTSLAIGTGTKTFTTQASKSFLDGLFVQVFSQANPTTNYMYGTVTSYNESTGALEIDVSVVGGSGTLADWLIVQSGARGPQGEQGEQGEQGPAGADGAMSGPVSSVAGNIATFADTTGDVVSDSGVAAANVLVDADIGVAVQGYDADTLKADTGDNLTAGFDATSDGDGTQSTGTYTPDPLGGNFKHITNGGAFTLGVPTNPCTIVVEITNNGSAGTITTSSYTNVSGDTLNTTNTNKFLLYVTKTQNYSQLTIKALQ